ncbi:MAG: rubrerythrin family protein [Dehalococcoidia bacterium]|nr:rubrerythrin family protein [Dehalococcoidia bacterium]
MWKCTNCHHVELSTDKPQRCPVCGAEAEKLVPHEVSGIKGTKTLKNLKAGFVAESQAHLRNLAFAMKAEQEGYFQAARLFRAIAEAEAVHAFNHFRLLGVISGTQENLESAFEKENLAASTYPQFVREANEEGNTNVATTFSYSRDVEEGHAKLYKKALAHTMAGEEIEYYVCQVCGYVSDGVLPDKCPICGAPKEKFRKVV